MVYNSGTYLKSCHLLLPFKGQKPITEFCMAIIVIHKGTLELRIDFTSENAKVEVFEHVTYPNWCEYSICM
jgi:hypothetical protein